MNYKVLGFVAGAVVAAVAVFAFNTWRDVSDQDRLTSVIAEHCLPFVQTGAIPYEGMGRPIGVYDGVNLSPLIVDGGSAMLFDNRFIAQWGNSNQAEPAFRICFLMANVAEDNGAGFRVATRAAVEELEAEVITKNDLVVIQDDLGSLPSVLIWEEPETESSLEGLRIMLTATDSNVGIITVTKGAGD